MLVGLLAGVSVALLFFFFISVALIIVNYKSNSTIKEEVRGLTEAVKKMSEAVVAMKEVVQFIHTKDFFNQKREEFNDEILPKKELARR